MTRRFLTIIVSIGLSSCNRTDDSQTNHNSIVGRTDSVTRISLSEQVYIYAPELDTLLCKATGGCDCCSGNILFLNDSDFVSIDYCESNTSYSKGKYRIDNTNLIITTDSISVSMDYNPEREADTTQTVLPEYFVTDTMLKTNTQTLKRITCKKTICFLMGDKETYYVTPDNEIKIPDFIKTLKENKIWERLKIENYR